MTREFPDRVSNVGNYLTQIAGSYLHTVAAGAWTACGVCALPVDGYSLCPQCNAHRSSDLPVADRAGFLVYADQPDSQTYRMMRGYKEHRTRATFEPIVQALLAVGLRGHFTCSTKLARVDDYGWVVVPSTKGRTVLSGLVRGLTTSPASEILVTPTGQAPDRNLSQTAWAILPSATPIPGHMVIIDDSWVSGASSQSLAVALKRAGASQVSILTIARVLSPQWGPSSPFLSSVLPTLAYEWQTCPWTRGECP